MDNNLILNHFKSDVTDVKRKYSKTFYAYQMRVKGRLTEFDAQLDAMMNNWVENANQPEWLSILSTRTNVDQDLLMAFYESINLPYAVGLDIQYVLYMIKHLQSIMKEKLELMDSFFSTPINAENARKFVLPKEANVWTENGFEKFFTLVEMYVKGLPLLDIE